jgi:acetoin utilization protein AcuC
VGDRLGVVWDDRLAEYDFGPGHPMAPVRVQLAMKLADEFGLFRHAGVQILGPVEPAAESAILRVHEAEYVAAVRRASNDPHFYDAARGLGTDDDPVFPNMHEAASRVAAATLMAAQAVHADEVDHAVNLAGGLHHALPGAAEGFCVYNDIAVAIAWLLDNGVERVAYVDVDVHHGDGVQAMFWDEPRVMTISIHESPASLFPGSGRASEIGGPSARGSAVNICVPAGTGDQGWLRALHAVVPDLLAAFKPQLILSQHGVDTHFEDPLAHLLVSLDGQRMAFEALHRWSHRYAGGDWVAVGGGGYEWVNVVPRAWTHLIAEASGHAIDPQTPLPDGFHEFVLEALGRQAPGRMTDGRQPWPRPFDQGFDPDDAVDAAILETRTEVFPHWGLTAEPGFWF